MVKIVTDRGILKEKSGFLCNSFRNNTPLTRAAKNRCYNNSNTRAPARETTLGVWMVRGGALAKTNYQWGHKCAAY